MKEDNKLSRDELEQLCNLFFEGMLTRSEEDDLARVLSATGERGGIIDETVFMLGIDRSARNVTGKHEYAGERVSNGQSDILLRFRKSFLRILYVSGVVACLIFVVSFAWNVVARPDKDTNSEVYAVYINGEEIKDEAEAKRVALSRYKESMAFLAEMKKMESDMMRELDNTREHYDSYVRMAEESMKDNNIK